METKHSCLDDVRIEHERQPWLTKMRVRYANVHLNKGMETWRGRTPWMGPGWLRTRVPFPREPAPRFHSLATRRAWRFLWNLFLQSTWFFLFFSARLTLISFFGNNLVSLMVETCCFTIHDSNHTQNQTHHAESSWMQIWGLRIRDRFLALFGGCCRSCFCGCQQIRLWENQAIRMMCIRLFPHLRPRKFKDFHYLNIICNSASIFDTNTFRELLKLWL